MIQKRERHAGHESHHGDQNDQHEATIQELGSPHDVLLEYPTMSLTAPHQSVRSASWGESWRRKRGSLPEGRRGRHPRRIPHAIVVALAAVEIL